MMQNLGSKVGSVIAAATAAAASSSSVAYTEAAVKRTPLSNLETRFKIEEDWSAIVGDEVWPVADISNEEIENAFQHAMQLVPHNNKRNTLQINEMLAPPPKGSSRTDSSSDIDSEDDDVIVLRTPAMAMEYAEQTMMPDLSHDRQRAEMDSMMFKMVNAVMRDTNVQRAFIQNPEFSDLLLKLKQGPRSLPCSAPLGPFEINEVPVSEPRTHMRTLEGHTLEGHIAHFARQFPKADHHDEVLEDAFMQFSEKLVDGVGSLICKLADSCRKVWEQSASLAQRLGGHHPPRAQNTSNQSESELKSDPYDPDNCAKAEAAPADPPAPEKPDAFLRGVMALAAIVFAIILFKRTGVMRRV
mmetsp:Transcript_37916/g.63774  ORF Transcript_37916/g.63774 Transcript_37916/m.63774 type:complete len:357 (-) Transcript_37916:627-1697(-)